jgi:hypothetical protein
MPPSRKEGNAVETLVSQNDDSKADSNMQPWTDLIVDEASNNFGSDSGLPMNNHGGGMDSDAIVVDDSMMGGGKETEVSNVTLVEFESLSVDLPLTVPNHFYFNRHPMFTWKL